MKGSKVRWIYIWIVFFIGSLLFILWLYNKGPWDSSQKGRYLSSSRYEIELLELAQKIGYTPGQLVRLSEETGSFPDSNYHIVRVIYHTEKSLDELDSTIKNLGYPIHSYMHDALHNNTSFLEEINLNTKTLDETVFLGNHYGLLPYDKKLGVRRELYLSKDEYPHVTEWVLENHTGREVKILVGQSNDKKDKWKVNDSEVTGNIVQIQLKIK